MAYDFNQANAFLSNITSTSKREIVTVNGYKNAQDYWLNRGESVLLLDSNEQLLYMKTCNEIGKCELKVYKCEDVTERYKNQEPAVITQSQINDLNAKIEKLTALLGEKNESNVKQPNDEQFEFNISDKPIRKSN